MKLRRKTCTHDQNWQTNHFQMDFLNSLPKQIQISGCQHIFMVVQYSSKQKVPLWS